MTKPHKTAKQAPKSARQRKSEFDQRMKNRGSTTPGAPERWACIFYLTEASKRQLKRYRDEARFLGDDIGTNAGLFEDMLRVYEVWRQMPEAARPEPYSSSISPPEKSRLRPTARVAFEEAISGLKDALGRTESCLDQLMDLHREEQWFRFDAMVARILDASVSGLDRVALNRSTHEDLTSYIGDLIELCERRAVADAPLDGDRGRLFREVLRRLKA